MVDIPNGSIYIWMYKQGLKQIPLEDIKLACSVAGKNIREKDYENYWNGFYKSDLYHGSRAEDIWILKKYHIKEEPEFFKCTWTEYPYHPYMNMPPIQNRWVPCNANNKPMIKWGDGCMMLSEAVAWPGQKWLAENLKGTRTIVIDCDGDHEEPWDYETMAFLWHYSHMTHTLVKPYDGTLPSSFHLTFEVDRIIPTMHFPYAHIDIAGNRRNQLRYWKNKEWNGMPPAKMTPVIWEELKKYIKTRRDKVGEFI